jgi:HlyD family secretion protein
MQNQGPINKRAARNIFGAMMDRPLDEIFRKKQITKRVMQGTIALVVIVGVFVWAPGWIQPSISKNRLRTAKVDSGPIEATITASGTVIPEFEQILTSPIDSRIIKILKRAGANLRKGEQIVSLDVTELSLALEKVNEELALKQNRQAQLKLDLERTLNDLQSQLQVKKLRMEFLNSNSGQQKRLFEIGASSKEQVRQAKLEEEIAAIELKQLENSIQNTQHSLQAQVEGLVLETKILQNEKTKIQSQLNLASTRAERDGVLSWVVSDEGATLRKGEVVARIADLTTFRVNATVSDVHATRLAAGLPVKVKINEEHLAGTISSVLPTIENGIITLLIDLEDKSSALLRSNLRVDVFIITSSKEMALRIKKGQFVNSEGQQEVFVVRDGVAVKTPVRLGISSFDAYEVIEGLSEGDEVIISDMRDFIHMKEVKIR